jgi:hypothetical protein
LFESICFWRYVQLSTITSKFWQVTILKVVNWFKVKNYIPKVTILWAICYTYICHYLFCLELRMVRSTYTNLHSRGPKIKHFPTKEAI